MPTIMERLTRVFREVFGDEEILLIPETTANEIEGWDSFSHINLIVAVELEFNIKFKQKDIYSFANVGELVKSIEEKIE